jgi:hypothetical protein
VIFIESKMKWLGYQRWKLIKCVEYWKLYPWRVNAKERSNWQPSWSQKEEKWQQSIWCKLKLKKLFFMFLEYRNTILLRRACGWSENNRVKSFSSIQNRNLQSAIVWPGWTMSDISWTSALVQKHSQKPLIRQYPASLDNVQAHQTMSGLTRHFRTYSRKAHFYRELPPDNVWSYRTMSEIWIWAQQLVS